MMQGNYHEIIYKLDDIEAELRVVVEALNVKEAIKNGVELLKGTGLDITEKYTSVLAVPFPTTDEVLANGEPF